MAGVLVSHPHACAVSIQTARALAHGDALSRFSTGFAFAAGTSSHFAAVRAARAAPSIVNRLVGKWAQGKLRSHALLELGTRGLGRLLDRVSTANVYDTLFAGHDLATALEPWPQNTRAVYAYEDGARWTFERARSRGLSRIYDLPSPYYRAVEAIANMERSRWSQLTGPLPTEPGWKRARKDAELELASLVCVASGFSRKSLEYAGVERRVAVVPYPFPVEQFQPKKAPHDGPFTVIAVGNQSARKGTHYLLEAFKRAALPEARLRLVGGLALPKSYLDGHAGTFEHVPPQPRAMLSQFYQEADLLAFPSVCDGFGLVMQEAMCCGTAVLATTSSGGPECISEDNGWLVPPANVDALVECLRAAYADRDRTRAMGRNARAAAESYTFAHFANSLLSKLGGALA